MLSRLRSVPAAAMLLSATLLIGLPAFADRVITIDSNGNVYDSFGHRIKHYDTIVTHGTTVVPQVLAPAVVTVPSTTIVRTEPAAPIVKRTITTTTTRPLVSTAITTDQFPDLLSDVLSARISSLQGQLAFVDETRALPLRRQLEQMNSEVVALRSCMTFDEALQMAQNLDAINSQCIMLAPSIQMSPLVLVEPSGARRIAGTNVSIY